MKQNELWRTVLLVFAVMALLMFLHARHSIRIQRYEKIMKMQSDRPISTSGRYVRSNS